MRASEKGKPGVPVTEVVAALAVRDGRFLICQRPGSKKRAFFWELPGGKVETGETPQQALVREIREELGAEILDLGHYAEAVYAYPDLTIRLTVFLCRMEGAPVLLEHRSAAWIRPEEIPAYVFCPADAEVMKEIARKGLE